jgi:hypothetical protein
VGAAAVEEMQRSPEFRSINARCAAAGRHAPR